MVRVKCVRSDGRSGCCNCGEIGALRQLWRKAPITAHSYLFCKRTLPNQVSSKSDHICQSYGHLKYSTPPGTCHVTEGATSCAHLGDPLTSASPRERLPLPVSRLAISGRLNMQNVRIWRFSLWGKISPPRRTPGDNVRHVVTRSQAPVRHPTDCWS